MDVTPQTRQGQDKRMRVLHLSVKKDVPAFPKVKANRKGWVEYGQGVNIFYELARTAKGVRGFRYGKRYAKGNGLDPYPLVWVDDPVLMQTASDSTQSYTVNVDILDTREEDKTVLGIQTWAELLALAFRERFREDLGGYAFERLSMVSLSEYVGDNAAGMRCTFILVGAYPINRCEEFFDPDKEITIDSPLPEFETKMADGCAVFSADDKLPRFRIQ